MAIEIPAIRALKAIVVPSSTYVLRSTLVTSGLRAVD